jgi:hypothetical protein
MQTDNTFTLRPAKHENNAALAEFRKREGVDDNEYLNVVAGGKPCVIEYDGFQYDVQETTNSWMITERHTLISFPVGHDLFAVTSGVSIIPLRVVSSIECTDPDSYEPYRNTLCFDIVTEITKPEEDLTLVDKVAHKNRFDNITHFVGRHIGDCVGEPLNVFTTLVDAKACATEMLCYQERKLKEQLRALQAQKATFTPDHPTK